MQKATAVPISNNTKNKPKHKAARKNHATYI